MVAQAAQIGRCCCIQLSEYPAGHSLHCLFWKLLETQKNTLSYSSESDREQGLAGKGLRIDSEEVGYTKLLFYIKL